MKHLKNFNNLNEEIGPNRDLIKNGLQLFLEEIINNIGNVFIISSLYRMLESGSFVKGGKEIFILTEEEKLRLNEIKPLIDKLIDDVSEIKKEIKKESDKEVDKIVKNFNE